MAIELYLEMKVSNMKGLVHFYYGYGKGKTSSAVGAAVRAAMGGYKVVFVQFLKNPDSSECEYLKNAEKIIYICSDIHCKFVNTMTLEEKMTQSQEHNRLLSKVKSYMMDENVLVVLDELGDAYELGMVDKQLVKEVLDNHQCEIVITGHGLIDAFYVEADYITVFENERHPFDNGVEARTGIEY